MENISLRLGEEIVKNPVQNATENAKTYDNNLPI